jgi:hypothetical protein
MESTHSSTSTRRLVHPVIQSGFNLTVTEQACDPTLPEPNYPVMVELADMIKSKKANRQVPHLCLHVKADNLVPETLHTLYLVISIQEIQINHS